MAFTLEIDIGQGPRKITIEPEDITLGFLEDMEEAQATSKWSPIRRAIGGLLGLSDPESRALTLKQFKAIGQALNAAAAEQGAVPNGP
jgi:hypothetical protein